MFEDIGGEGRFSVMTRLSPDMRPNYARDLA